MLAGGTAIAQILNIATSPVISRLFSPDDFGVLSVYTSILSIVAVFATLRYEFAIPIAEDDKSAINVLALTLGSVGFISVLSLAVFSFFGDVIANLLNAQQMKPYFWLVSVGILASGIYTAFRYWAFRKKNFETITKTTVNQSVAHQAINLLWGFFIGGPIGLIVGTIVGRSAGIWTLSKDIRKDKTGLLKSISLRETMRLAKRYVKFPLYSSGSGALNMLGLQLPVLLLSSYFGTGVTGSFGFANRILGIPMHLIGAAIGDVFFGEVASISHSNPERILQLSRKLFGRLVLIGLVPFSVLAIFGPWLFSLVFGEVWIDAGVYARILSLTAFSRLAVTPISRVFNVFERQKLDMALNASRAGLVVLVFIFSKGLNLSAEMTIVLYSLAMTFVYVLTYLLSQSVITAEIRKHKSRSSHSQA